jgi:signal peptidase I
MTLRPFCLPRRSTTVSLRVVSESEPEWRQPAAPDLNARIAAGVRQRRHGRHARIRGTRRAPRQHSRLSRGLRLLGLVAVTVLGVVLLRSFVIASFYIPSESMEPTLHGCATCEPDRVLVDKLSYNFRPVHRKDVVVFTKPPRLQVSDNDLIKRVIGLPGETVEAHDGSVYVNGNRLTEPYVNPACGGTQNFGPVTVSAGHYFVMGDNRCFSSDSRVFGSIPRSSIVGNAFAVVWPLKHLRWL